MNVTDTWQFPPAAIEDPHVFPTTSNGAAVPIDTIFSGSVFGFVIVRLLAADTEPTCTLPNASESGENVGFARIPVPVSVADCGLPAASSVIVKFPF